MGENLHEVRARRDGTSGLGEQPADTDPALSSVDEALEVAVSEGEVERGAGCASSSEGGPERPRDPQALDSAQEAEIVMMPGVGPSALAGCEVDRGAAMGAAVERLLACAVGL